ncbi:helix-turn-helix transcriptional regulator [Streptococcus suis]|uniref:TetR/AcrR family transcriptional regulator n=1 Tax=Streptococcus TaxID=1301 RepID=UPI0004083AFD|nr:MULTISPECIES: TetR/AcrR family transcriptional regulator [Streptococcus]MBL1126330.1 helix-turn-helix transcriptional regulator [Streptococcus suis]MCK3934949.1 helix-turn-helix transcriptional regulator [Streptococcus suis]HEM3612242.1 helix-turn-helix transcriptional regulator [Streptococcus suis]HEM3622881.1 helix-turn-helix transcriptional regulator [Streptococcus suis]HEM3627087.1 helix-turn-helix transcriptional regulator [Streptococcus suis]
MTQNLRAKDFIVQALFKLIESKNYDDITITDIAKKAGVTRISFYRNFDSKEDILRQEMKKRYETQKLTKDTEFSIGFMFEFFNQNKDLISVLFKSKKEVLLLELIESDNITQLPLEVAYSVATVNYLLLGWANAWYQRGMVDSTEEILKRIKQ